MSLKKVHSDKKVGTNWIPTPNRFQTASIETNIELHCYHIKNTPEKKTLISSFDQKSKLLSEGYFMLF